MTVFPPAAVGRDVYWEDLTLRSFYICLGYLFEKLPHATTPQELRALLPPLLTVADLALPGTV